MFPPLDIPLEYWIEHVTFGLRYVMFGFSTGKFQALQLIVLEVFGIVDLLYVGALFLEILFEMIVGW